eukprot:g18936.t1
MLWVTGLPVSVTLGTANVDFRLYAPGPGIPCLPWPTNRAAESRVDVPKPHFTVEKEFGIEYAPGAV